MHTRKVLNFLLILSIGFALGWLLKPKDPQLSAHETAVAQPAIASTKSETPQALANKVPTSSTELESQQAMVSELRANRLSEVNIAKEWTLDEVLEAINTENNNELYNSNLFDYFRSNPELAAQLLDQYLDLENPSAKQIATELLRIANMNNDFGIERQIIGKIELGDNQAKWLSVLSDFGINTPESMQFLSQQLDYSLQGQEITDALNAINKGSNRLFNKIPRQTRELVTQQLVKQVNSLDPKTRAAAINSLAAYPIHDSESVIIGALSDPDRLVQYSALQTLMRGEFQSAEIRDALMGVIRDNTIDLGLRAATAQTLRRYNLEGQDYDDLYSFNQELEDRAQERRRQNQKRTQ